MIDDVRWSAAALDRTALLPEPAPATIGSWTFEERPGFLAEAGGAGPDLERPGVAAPVVPDVPGYEALVDLCHVLFNSSDFLHVE